MLLMLEAKKVDERAVPAALGSTLATAMYGRFL